MTDATAVPLLVRPVVYVRQRAKLVELRNSYELLDELGQPIGVVEQVGQSGVTVLARVVSDLDVALPVTLEVRQGDQPVLRLHKPWLRMAVQVSHPSGEPIGTVRKQIRLGKAVFALLDSGGAEVGAVRADSWRAKDFAVVDGGGREVARVAKQWAGLAREVLTDADHYAIHRPEPLEDPVRSLALAAPFAIDLVMKQKDS